MGERPYLGGLVTSVSPRVLHANLKFLGPLLSYARPSL